MIPLLEQNRQEIEILCRRYCVARLDVFGSATSGQFDSSASDLDFLVEFQPDSPMGPFHQYFDFLAELRVLLGREVDLVEAGAMKNPYFIKSVNQSRELLYAA
ncbi:MAG: nucleotidyltransferase domain-containing protein [Planctomycetota bacterium]|nr:MAG: nucleotidyltransferase domain-containing protein [Planctomycetota bacterium]